MSKCSECKYWTNVGILTDVHLETSEPETTDYSECRFNPPCLQGVCLGFFKFKGVWPLTHKDSFCGQFVALDPTP